MKMPLVFTAVISCIWTSFAWSEVNSDVKYKPIFGDAFLTISSEDQNYFWGHEGTNYGDCSTRDIRCIAIAGYEIAIPACNNLDTMEWRTRNTNFKVLDESYSAAYLKTEVSKLIEGKREDFRTIIIYSESVGVIGLGFFKYSENGTKTDVVSLLSHIFVLRSGFGIFSCGNEN